MEEEFHGFARRIGIFFGRDAEYGRFDLFDLFARSKRQRQPRDANDMF